MIDLSYSTSGVSMQGGPGALPAHMDFALSNRTLVAMLGET